MKACTYYRCIYLSPLGCVRGIVNQNMVPFSAVSTAVDLRGLLSLKGEPVCQRGIQTKTSLKIGSDPYQIMCLSSGKLVKARVCFGFVLQIFFNVEALIRQVLYFLSGSQPCLPRRGLVWDIVGTQ